MLSADVKLFDDLIDKILTLHLREQTSLGLSLPEKNCRWNANRDESVKLMALYGIHQLQFALNSLARLRLCMKCLGN